MLAAVLVKGASAQDSQADSVPAQKQSCAKRKDSGDARVSWVRLVPDIGCDQKRIWTFPARLVKGQNLVPTLAVIGVTAALAASDPQTEGPLRSAKSFHGFDNVFSSTNSVLITAAVPAAVYFAGLARHDSYAEKSALLAGEAVADAEIVSIAMKGITQRLRPNGVPPGGNLADTWFEYGKSSALNSSFPSGHALAAFAVAAVMTRRYARHRWVPWVAYGLAGVIGFSRLTDGEHFPSDMFMGAAIGYTISRFVVTP